MRKHKKIKCGGYIYKNGVIIKRPGKTFRAPPLPERLRIPYPPCSEIADVYLPTATIMMSDEYENIDQMNALKQDRFQKPFRAEYKKLRALYYYSQIMSCLKRSIKRLKQYTLPVAKQTEHQREG